MIAVSSALHAEEPKLLNLQNIESTISEDAATITLSFNEPVSERVFDLKEQDGFFQITMPNTLVLENNKFYDGKAPFLKKIAVYQVSPNSAVARIYVGAYDLSKSTKAILKTTMTGKNAVVRLPLSIFHKDVITPASTHEAPAKSPTLLLGDHDLEFYIQRLGIFSILFFASIFSFLSLKRFQKNKVFKAAGDGNFKMKTLSQLVLSPRQKLCLIQVGSEQILIAVSPDQVTLMTRLANPDAPKNLAIAETDGTDHRRKISTYKRPEKFLDSLKQTMNGIEGKAEIQQEFVEQPSAPEKKSIHYAIGDDGIADKTKESKRAIDDITRLIREKLKALPQI